MNSDPLSGLKDIHLPPDIGWWPPAIGWWLVIALAGIVLGFAGYMIIKYFNNRRYRKEALAELREIFTRYQESRSVEKFLQDISVLLRRVAIQAYGRIEVADLSGNQWLEFLGRTGSTDDFIHGSGSALGSDLYKPKAAADPEKVYSMVEKWIRKHKSSYV